MIRVFLVDDHELVRRGIAGLLGAESDIEIVGEAGTATQARSRIAATRPDVALLDVRLPDGNGIDVCRDLGSSDPENLNGSSRPPSSWPEHNTARLV